MEGTAAASATSELLLGDDLNRPSPMLPFADEKTTTTTMMTTTDLFDLRAETDLLMNRTEQIFGGEQKEWVI